MTATAAPHRGRRASLGLLVGLLLAIAGTLVPTARADAADPTRVMFLGDSITGSPGCWRALLWQDLQAAGHTDLDAVGTLGPQGCGVAHDGDNEGHGGALVTTVAAQGQLVGWLDRTDPDVVVMHFGTNDVWSGRSTQQVLDAYTTLVRQMREANPAMRVLVAQIIPVAPPTCAECPARTVALNDAIPAWAASLSTAASPITVVDQWTGWDARADTTDGVHPDDSGTRKLADRWFEPLVAAITGAPAPDPGPGPDPDPDPDPGPDPEQPLPPLACVATTTVQSRWSGGFVATVEVRANEPMTGWGVGIFVREGTDVAHVWNAVREPGTSGLVGVENAPWNGTLAPGATTTFGFQGTGSPDGILATACSWR